MAQVARAIMGYRWATMDDGKRFLGWIVSSIVGGAMEWRPHLLLTAPASQGKTWLLTNVMEKIMGPLLTSISDATPAAISRLTAHSSLPIAIDEAEPSEDWVLELLKTLRAASSDFGSRIRVAPNGVGVTFQQARFSALLAGTVAPALAKADETRLTPVSFGPPVDNWPAVRLAIRSAMEHAPAVRYRVIRRAKEIVDMADKLSDEMQDLGMDSREAMASAALTAGWRFWGVDDAEVFSQPVEPGVPQRTDAADALLEILALRHRHEYGDISVLKMLGKVQPPAALADLFGIKRQDDGIIIAAKHRGLVTAMSRTKWAQADVRKLLLQLEGAGMTASAHRFGQLRVRGVFIPEATLQDIGVELETEEEDK